MGGVLEKNVLDIVFLYRCKITLRIKGAQQT
jgi:hypothetical protein